MERHGPHRGGGHDIAPGFEPIIRVPVGLIAKEATAWKQGLSSMVAGYVALIAGSMAALLVSAWVSPSTDQLGARHRVQYRSSVNASSVLVALAAGAAGAAVIAAQRSVLSAGVMIALALVPSAAIIGMAMAQADFQLAGGALARWATGAACVVAAGAAVFLIKRSSHDT